MQTSKLLIAKKCGFIVYTITAVKLQINATDGYLSTLIISVTFVIHGYQM